MKVGSIIAASSFILVILAACGIEADKPLTICVGVFLLGIVGMNAGTRLINSDLMRIEDESKD